LNPSVVMSGVTSDSAGYRADGLEVSLKLYHVCDLWLGYQQSMTEAPSLECVSLSLSLEEGQ
jgi:hypothetical protein